MQPSCALRASTAAPCSADRLSAWRYGFDPFELALRVDGEHGQPTHCRKRSIDGTHHHVSRAHLHRYLAEFDFRYSHCKVSDQGKMEMIINRTSGRRMTSKRPTQCLRP